MKISLYVIGKTNFTFVKEGIEIYSKRLKHYLKFEIIELPDVKGARNMLEEEIKEREGTVFLKKIPQDAHIILLDENGKEFNSRQFAGEIEKKIIHSVKHLVFVVGGAYGFSDEMYTKSKSQISLSQMTFSHQIIRLIFMEQIYRALTIIKGEPYHND